MFSVLGRSLCVLWLAGVTQLVCAANYLSHSLDNQSLVIVTDEGKVTLTAFHEAAVEVFYQPSEIKQLPSYAIAGLPEQTAVEVVESTERLRFLLPDLQVNVQKWPLRVAFEQNGRTLLQEAPGLFVHDALRGFRFRLQQDEKLMGGGQRVLGMDRRGHRMPLYNRAHYGYGTQSNQMYYGLPAVMSNQGYALVFDNSASGHLDIGYSKQDRLQFDAVGGRTSYLVTVGDDYREQVTNLTRVLGRQPLPPRWALGNFASRFGYHSEAEVRDVVNRFKQADMPLDAVVLDLFWFGKELRGHMGNLAWDRQAFPQPEEMMADLQDKGIQTVLISEPFVLTSSKNWGTAAQANALAVDPEGTPKTYDFFFGNTSLIDVFRPSGQDWFAEKYAALWDQGVRGWWGDLGEPEVHPSDTLHREAGRMVSADEIHNAYGHKWAEMLYRAQREFAPDSRPMMLMRSGFAGTQRFGIMPWTGDVARSWDGLKPQVELTLQMGMLGLAYTHSDLGGYAGGEHFDREMYIRWLQYGVFQPVYRPHAQEAIASEPVFHDELTQSIVREYLHLRYQMLPYNYSLAFENSLTGLPLMRPMLFEDSTDVWFDEKAQYMWGDAFLVKPVTEANVKRVDVRLPAGSWIDFWSGVEYAGNQTVSIQTQLAHLPVLVKAGSFVPMADEMATTQDYQPDTLNLHYYASETVTSSSGNMYEDDGKDPDSIKNNAFQTLLFSMQRDERQAVLRVATDGMYPEAPVTREINVTLHNWRQPLTSVQMAGQALDFQQDRNKRQVTFTLQHSGSSEVHMR